MKNAFSHVEKKVLLAFTLCLLFICFLLPTAAAEVPDATVSYDFEFTSGAWQGGFATFTAPTGYTIGRDPTDPLSFEETLIHPSSHDGEFTYYLKKDGTDEIVAKTMTLRLDADAPIVPDESPVIVAVKDTMMTVIANGWQDAHSGLKDYTIEVKQGEETKTAITNGTGNFTVKGLDPNTAYTVNIIARDHALNQRRYTLPAPVVTERADITGAVIGFAPAYVYTGAPVIPADAVVTIVTADGKNRVVPAEQLLFAYGNNIAVGSEAVLTVTAKEGGDYVGTASAHFVIDYLQTDKKATIVYGLTGEDGWYGDFATFRAPNGWEISFDDLTYVSVPLIYNTDNDGSVEIVYYLKNAAGEIARKSVYFKLDTVVPSITDISVFDVTDRTATVTAAATDLLSGVKGYMLHVVGLGSFSPAADGNFYLEGLDRNKTYTYTVSVTDKAGNEVESDIKAFTTAQTDLGDVTVEITVNGNAPYYFTGFPIAPQKSDVTVTVEGIAITAADFALSYADNVAVGMATLTVTGQGDFKGTGTGHFEITYLVTADEAAVQFGKDLGTIKGGNLTLTPPAGYSISLTVDGVYATDPVVYENSHEGAFLYYLKNAAGEIAEKSITFVLDAEAPVVDNVNIADLSSNYAHIEVSATDTGAAAAEALTYRLEINSTVYENSAGIFHVTGLIMFTEYPYTLTVTDAAGNTSAVTTGSVHTSKTSLSEAVISVIGEYTYDGTPILPVVRVSIKGITVDAEQYTVTAENNIRAGAATVTVTAKSGDAYSYSGSVSREFTIEKAPLTVKAHPQTVIYGEDIVDNVANATVSGLCTGDRVFFSLVVKDGRIIAENVQVNNADGDATENYVIAAEDAALTVAPSSPTVTIDGLPSVDKIYDGTPALTPAYTVSGGAFTGEVTVVWYANSVLPQNLLTEAPVLPGTYYAVALLAATAENNAAASDPMELNIQPRSITVLPHEQMIGFGYPITSRPQDAFVSTEAGGLDLLAGHRIARVTLTALDTAVTENGRLAVTAVRIVDADGVDVTRRYDITMGTGKLVIKAATFAEAEVFVDGYYTYTGAPICPTDITVILKGEIVPADEYIVEYTDHVDAGVATVTITGILNYGGTATGNFVIGKAQATVQTPAVSADDLVYTGKQQLLVSTMPAASGTYIEYRTDMMYGYSADVRLIYGVEAGTYRIYYRAAGDNNHLPSEPLFFEVTIDKTDLNMIDLPFLTEHLLYGDLLSAQKLSGGYVTMLDGYTVVEGTWYFADAVGTVDHVGTYDIVFKPLDFNNHNAYYTTIDLTPVASPLLLTLKPDHTHQFAGQSVQLHVEAINGTNTAFTGGIPTAFTFTWQIGEDGVPNPIEGNSFVIPADLAMDTVLIVKVASDAVADCYEAAFAEATVTVSNKLSVTLGATDRVVFSPENTFDVSALFEIDPLAGEATYTIVGGTGAGTLVGTLLTVTASGSFEIRVDTAAHDIYAEGTVTAWLTYTVDADHPVISGVADGKTYYFTQIVTVEDANLDSILLNGETVTSPVVLAGNVEAVYVLTVTDKAGNTAAITVTMHPLALLASALQNLELNNVTSADRLAIVTVAGDVSVLDDSHATEAEKAEATAILSRCDELLARIDSVGAVLGMVLQGVDHYDIETVKVTDQEDLAALLEKAKSLDGSDNLTAEETASLVASMVALQAMIDRINAVADILDTVTADVAVYEINTVTSDDRDDLAALLEEAKSIDGSKNLTAEETESLVAAIAALQAMIDRVDDVADKADGVLQGVEKYRIDTVTSADRSDLSALLTLAESLEGSMNLTMAEADDLSRATASLTAMIGRIDNVADLLSALLKSVEAYDIDAVTSVDETQLQALLADAEALRAFVGNMTTEEAGALDEATAAIKAMLDRIAAVRDEIARIEDAASDYEDRPLTGADKEDLFLLITAVNDLLTINNLTAEERADMVAIRAVLVAKLNGITGFESEIKELLSAIDGYDINTVKSSDLPALNDLLNEINVLFEDQRLLESEREVLAEATQKLETLIGRVNAAAAAMQTDAIKAVASVDESNVTPDLRPALEAALSDLAGALSKYTGNYTDAEKAMIAVATDRIERAIKVLDRVSKVEDKIHALPDPNTVVAEDKNTRNKYTEVENEYQLLGDYEKTLVSKELTEKLFAVGIALSNYRVWEGDGRIFRMGSKEGLVFKINGPMGKFKGIRVDGQLLDSDYYTVNEDEKGTVVEILAECLERFSAEHHQILFLYSDGDAHAYFSVESAPFPIWAGCIIAAAVTAVVILLIMYIRKKQEERENTEIIHENT